MDNCNPILTPVEERLKLTKDGLGELVNSTEFKGLVGCLRYLTATRPDIMYAVGLVSRFMESPRQSYLQAAKRIPKYKQQVVALSTTEAEYIAASNCAAQAVWLRMMLKSLFQEQTTPTTIVCDNKSTISLTKNLVLHGRSKHIDIKYHYIRELFSNKEIAVDFVESEEQISEFKLTAGEDISVSDWLKTALYPGTELC
ncbi:uncharacterized protein LOC113312558 [Papaver somniferum]|uniref:uncharacterized protein LOC113312558 n=1 Tax=Papaver somniferum TaxID=3469 RepID=UPI000E7042F9|nr:uncharacterized protein LOC113312558 [Papaver somniferum]